MTRHKQKSAKFSFQMVFTFFPFFNQQPEPYLAWTYTDWKRRRLNARKSQTKTSSEVWSEFTNLIWWHWAELWLTHTGGSNDDAGYRSTFLCHSLQHLYEPRQNVFIYLEKQHQRFFEVWRFLWSSRRLPLYCQKVSYLWLPMRSCHP